MTTTKRTDQLEIGDVIDLPDGPAEIVSAGPVEPEQGWRWVRVVDGRPAPIYTEHLPLSAEYVTRGTDQP